MKKDNVTIKGIESIKETPVNLDIEKANEKRKVAATENATKTSHHIHKMTIFFIYAIPVSVVLMIFAYVGSYYFQPLKIMHSDIGGWIGNIFSVIAGFVLSIIYDKTKS